MIMNGVEVDIPSTTNAAHIPIMPVDEHVVSSSEIGMADLSGVRMDEDMGLEVKPEEDMDKLKERLRHQLEYYFSNQNLAKDDYLKYQMDEQQYVPIRTIATFNLVQKLTTDIDLITEVLKSSTLVEVDEKREKVRQSQTNIAALILREIPEDTPVESVKGLFDGDDCPKFLSCQFAANTSWYVTFESENDAQEAYRHLRERVKNFLGKPIMARIKSKTPDQRRPAAPPPAEKRNTEKAEKPAKSQQKQSKGNSDSPQKTVAEPSKGSANEKNTVPTADTDAGKKLSYAEMLRKKTAGRPAAMSETDKTEPGTDTAAAEEAPAAEPRPQQTQKHPEAPAVNGEAGQDEKSAPSDDSEGDEKPWESAGPNKRSHRGDRDHGGPHPSSRGRGGRGRGRGRGGYGRGGGRYGSGRDKVNGFNNDRQTLGAGDAAQRKR